MEKVDPKSKVTLWQKIGNDRVRVFRTANLYLSFFSLGLCMSVSGPTLPDLQRNVGANTSQMGYVLSAKFVGYCVGSLLAGFLFNRFHRFLLFTILLFAMSAANIAIPFQNDLALLIFFMVLSGLVFGAVDTGGNVLCLDLWCKNPAPFFQALHFNFGIGSVVGPLIAEPFLSPEDEDAPENSTLVTTTQSPIPKDVGNVVASFSIISAIICVVGLSNLASFILDRAEVRSNCEKERVSNQVRGKFLPRCLIAFGMVFVAAYVSLENTYGQFLVTFLKQSKLKMTKSQGSFMTSTFWGTYCFVRGCSIYGATKIQPLYMLIFNLTIISITSILMAVFGESNPWVMWLGSALLGLGCASCWPSSVAWLEIYVGISNLVSSLFVVSGSLAAFLLALLVAHFMDDHPAVFLYTISVSSIICICAFAAQLKVTQSLKSNRKQDLTYSSNNYLDKTENYM